MWIVLGIVVFIAAVALWNRPARETYTQANAPRTAPRNNPNHAPFRFDASLLPPQLGLLDTVAPLRALAQRLEAAIGDDYAARLRERVLAEHAGMSADEFECRFFELKRFFLMSALLKETPMFGEAVDEIWHEMLMFTQEYQRFGEQFTGATLHHAPNGASVPMPGQRAWFDWIYAHLYAAVPSSVVCWGPFFRFPLDKERMNFMNSASPEQIKISLFNEPVMVSFPEAKQAVETLIEQFQDELNHARRTDDFRDSRWYNRGASNGAAALIGGMIFYSLLNDEDYSQNMRQLSEEAAGDEGGSYYSTSSCSSSDGGSDNGSGGGGGGGGSSSSCSSGSSCNSSSSCSSSSSSSSSSSCSSSSS